MIVTQIIAAPEAPFAVSYNTKKDALIYEKCTLIGLVQLENPDVPEDIQQVPCYLVCDETGWFYVPELEFDFLTYVPHPHQFNLENYRSKIEEIRKIHEDGNKVEIVEVETKGKVSRIKRSVQRIADDDDNPSKTTT